MEPGSLEAEGRMLLEDGCARNAPIDIQYRTPAGDLRVAKSRLLGLGEEGIYLDSPHGAVRDVRFSVGQPIECHFMLNEVRYVFRTTVASLNCTVQLNAEKRVVGIVIAPPVGVQEGQRRTHFRVSMLGNGPIRVDMHSAHPEIDGACAINAHRCGARLVNLSAGGAGIQVTARDALRLKVGQDLYMTITLPDDPEPFGFLAEIRQLWKVPGATGRRLGLRIKPWPSRRKLELAQQRLQRYITAVQRNQLRRTG